MLAFIDLEPVERQCESQIVQWGLGALVATIATLKSSSRKQNTVTSLLCVNHRICDVCARALSNHEALRAPKSAASPHTASLRPFR